MRPWILRACHVNASYHLGVHLAFRTVECFYCLVDMNRSIRWWARACLVYQALKTPSQTIRWPVLTMPVPNAPSLVIRVDFFGPLPLTARGYSQIFPFTDRCSRRADMLAFTAAGFAAKGIANMFVNRYITYGDVRPPSSPTTDNGLQFTSKIFAAMYQHGNYRFVQQTNGGTGRGKLTTA